MKHRAWTVPAFFVLLAFQVLLVILNRTGVNLPISATFLSGIRLALALLMIAILAFWSIQEWRVRQKDGSDSVS